MAEEDKTGQGPDGGQAPRRGKVLYRALLLLAFFVLLQASAMNEETIVDYSTPIIFAPGAASFDAEALSYLKALATDLTWERNSAKTKLYIVGLAADERDGKSQWALSARRAEAVHKALERLLSRGRSDSRRELFSWGVGPGGWGVAIATSWPEPGARKAIVKSAERTWRFRSCECLIDR